MFIKYTFITRRHLKLSVKICSLEAEYRCVQKIIKYFNVIMNFSFIPFFISYKKLEQNLEAFDLAEFLYDSMVNKVLTRISYI